MQTWVECPQLEIDLDLPHDQRYRAIPPEASRCGHELLACIMSEVPAAARTLADAVRLRTANRFHREACALARVTGDDWRSVILANIAYDLVLSTYGCSTVALATPDGPVVARNMDWWPEDVLARTSYLIRARRGGELAFANAGWPGAIGAVSALSARGFAVVLNAVTCSEGINRTGYPVLLHIRRVIEDAAGFDEAVRMLSDARLAASCLLTVVGTTNEQRVIIERTPRLAVHRRADGNRPLMATNHYRALESEISAERSDAGSGACPRYEALIGRFGGAAELTDYTDEELLTVLTDPAVIQEITAQHVIVRPSRGEIRLFVPARLVR